MRLPVRGRIFIVSYKCLPKNIIKKGSKKITALKTQGVIIRLFKNRANGSTRCVSSR